MIDLKNEPWAEAMVREVRALKIKNPHHTLEQVEGDLHEIAMYLLMVDLDGMNILRGRVDSMVRAHIESMLVPHMAERTMENYRMERLTDDMADLLVRLGKAAWPHIHLEGPMRISMMMRPDGTVEVVDREAI